MQNGSESTRKIWKERVVGNKTLWLKTWDEWIELYELFKKGDGDAFLKYIVSLEEKILSNVEERKRMKEREDAFENSIPWYRADQE